MSCPHIFIMRLVFFLSVPRKQLHVQSVENLQRQNDGEGAVPARQGPVKGHAEARQLALLHEGGMRGQEGCGRDHSSRAERKLVFGEASSKVGGQGDDYAKRRAKPARRNPSQ